MKVRYRGLIVGINPAEMFINKKWLIKPGLFPIRILVAFDREYDYSLKSYKSVYNPDAVDKGNTNTYFFEHLVGVIPESVVINGHSGFTLQQLLDFCSQTRTHKSICIISSCTVVGDNTFDIVYKKRRKEEGVEGEISVLEVEGEGPLYPRIHKGSGKPFKGMNYDPAAAGGEVLLHLDKVVIKKLLDVKIN